MRCIRNQDRASVSIDVPARKPHWSSFSRDSGRDRTVFLTREVTGSGSNESLPVSCAVESSLLTTYWSETTCAAS